jgi:radical SAM protein with 4Fe4S-binding SPASM domain
MKRFQKVYLEISNICNLSCAFCPGTKRNKKVMSDEEFRLLLPKLRPWTDFLYFHLMGEPTAHPLLPDFLRDANVIGFRTVITTNGTPLDRRGDDILAAGVHKVSISLHSFEGEDGEGHLAYLAKIADFADKATKAGVIVSLRLWNGGEANRENRETLAYLRTRLSGEWQTNTRGIRIRERLHLEWGERFEWPDKDAPDGGEDVFCYGLSDHFGILADGTVVPCCLDSEGTVALGNIFRDDLAAILSSPRAVAIREGFKRRRAAEDLCRRCDYARRF